MVIPPAVEQEGEQSVEALKSHWRQQFTNPYAVLK